MANTTNTRHTCQECGHCDHGYCQKSHQMTRATQYACNHFATLAQIKAERERHATRQDSRRRSSA